MINYKSFLKFFIVPVVALSSGIAIGSFILNKQLKEPQQVEKFNPPVALRGCVYNEGQKLPEKYNIIVGLYKNYEDIQNSTPVINTVITDSTDRCFKIQVDPSFVLTPGFIVSYVVPSNITEPIPLEKGMILNDWYNAIIFPENMYKNVFLSQKWDSTPEVTEEVVTRKPSLGIQDRKTLIWNSEQLSALAASSDYEEKGLDAESMSSDMDTEQNTDTEIKSLLQQNGVDLSNGFNEDAKTGYHKLISEYFDYLYNENEKLDEDDENTPVKQFSFKEYLADRKDKLNQTDSLKRDDLDMEKKALTFMNKVAPTPPAVNTATQNKVIPNYGGEDTTLQETNKKLRDSSSTTITKTDTSKLASVNSSKKRSVNGQEKIEEKEVSTYTLEGDLLPPAGSKDLCSLAEKSSPMISVDLFLVKPEKNFPVVPRDYTLHTETPLANSFVDCRSKSFTLKDVKLENIVGKESPSIYIYAYIYETLSPDHIDVLYAGTDNNINGIPLSLLVRKTDNKPVEIQLKKNSDTDSTLFSVELFDYYNQNTIDDVYLKPTGLDMIPKLDSMVSIYRTASSKSGGWARLQSLPFASLIPFELNDSGGADGYIPTMFSITSATPDFTTSVPMIKQSELKQGTAGVLISVPPYLKSGEVLLLSSNSKNKNSFVFNSSDKSNLLFAKDITSFDKALLDLRVGNKSLGLMPVYPKVNKLLVVEPLPKTIKTIKGNISILKELSKPAVPCADCRINFLYTEKSATTAKDGSFVITDVAIIDDIIEYEIEANGLKKTISSTIVARSMDNLEIKITIPDAPLQDAWAKSSPTTPSEGILYGDLLSYKSYKAFLISADKNTSKKALYFDDKTLLPTDVLTATSSTTSGAGTDRFLFAGVFPGNYILYIVSGDKVLHIRPVRIEPNVVTVIN